MGATAISHDVAYRTSLRVVQVFAPLLRDEEQVDAVREVYPLVKAALAAFAERTERERRRLGRPGDRPVATGDAAATSDPAGES